MTLAAMFRDESPVTEEPMDFLFVTDDLATLQPAHDSSVALMEAAQARGHRVLATTVAELAFVEDRVVASCREVSIRASTLLDGAWLADSDWVTVGPTRNRNLDDVAAIFMRTDPPVDAAYLRATYLLDLVDPRTLMVNSPGGVRTANEKLFALALPELGPPTLVSADRAQIHATVLRWGRAVLKPTDAMAGRGILCLDPGDPNLHSILDTATERGQAHVVVQQWLPASVDGDRRVIVLDGVPVGAVRRVAREGEFRCNMAAGARVVRDGVTEIDRSICRALAPMLREHGLHLVGIDVIGDRLTEVNVTSPTGLREIQALSGELLADMIISWVESRCLARLAIE